MRRNAKQKVKKRAVFIGTNFINKSESWSANLIPDYSWNYLSTKILVSVRLIAVIAHNWLKKEMP